MKIPLPTQSYQSRSLPVSAQRLVNLYPEVPPQPSKGEVTLLGTPGIRDFADAGAGPLRGLIVMGGVLFAVSGAALYRISATGAATSLGAIAGTGPVSMAENGVQTCIVANGAGYICTAAGVLTKITDTDFPGASSVTFQDGYFIFTRPGSGQFFISSLYDGKTFDALDFATAEGSPDQTVAVLSDHRELWLFGERSTEIWYNSGAADFPFERNQGAFLERGCAAAHSVAKLDNSVFWLGNDGIVYRAQGYAPARISTHAIERVIAEYGDASNARAWTYTQEGHAFYVLTFPDRGTWVFDAATGLWHERQSFGLDQWRASCHAYAYGLHLVGDSESGKIGALDLDTHGEWGSTVQAIAAFPPIHAEQRRLTMSALEIDMETGVGITTGQGSDPQIMLDWSDDGGFTWSTQQPWASIGKIGERRIRVRWRRLGQFRERVLRVTISDPVKRAIHGAYADMAKGAA